jgi:hypothetical protein
VSRQVARTLSLVTAVAIVTAVAGCGAGGPGGGDGTPPDVTPPDRPATAAPEADVGLDLIHAYPPASVTVAAGRPVTVEIPGTDGIIDRIAAEAERDPDAVVEVVVTIEFGEADRWPDYSIVVLVNTPDADTPDADTPGAAADAAGFVGTVAFPHGDPPAGGDPLRVFLPATGALSRTAGSGPVTITLLPQRAEEGGGGASPAGHTIDVTVTLSLMRTTTG